MPTKMLIFAKNIAVFVKSEEDLINMLKNVNDTLERKTKILICNKQVICANIN